MSYISNEDLRNLCIQNGWFEGGTEEQYEKLFEANTSGASDEKLSIMIYLCSDTSQEEILKILRNYKIKFPNLGDTYWRINERGYVVDDRWSCAQRDYKAFSCGNCFTSEASALYTLKALKVYYNLKHFAEVNNTEEIDWTNEYSSKFCITYDYHNNNLFIDDMQTVKYPNTVYFTSEKIAENAINEIGEDNIKKYLFGIEE